MLAAVAHWQGNWNDSGVNARPAFLLEAQFKSKGGSSSLILTDETWKTLATTGFIETNATYFGGDGGTNNRAAVQFDATLEPKGWTTLDFNDSQWSNSTVVARPEFKLFAQSAALQQEQAELEPASIKRSQNSWLVDFGRCVNGWPKLTMRANQKGDKIRVNYYQMNGLRAKSGWDQYTCGGGNETWKPDMGRHGPVLK